MEQTTRQALEADLEFFVNNQGTVHLIHDALAQIRYLPIEEVAQFSIWANRTYLDILKRTTALSVDIPQAFPAPTTLVPARTKGGRIAIVGLISAILLPSTKAYLVQDNGEISTEPLEASVFLLMVMASPLRTVRDVELALGMRGLPNDERKATHQLYLSTWVVPKDRSLDYSRFVVHGIEEEDKVLVDRFLEKLLEGLHNLAKQAVASQKGPKPLMN